MIQRMSEQNKQSEEIANFYEYKLLCSISELGSKMKLMLSFSIFHQSMNIVLEATFSNLEQLGGLKYYCDSFYDVKEYLRNKDNFDFDRDNMVMVVYGKKINSGKISMLTCIRFQPVQSDRTHKIRQSVRNDKLSDTDLKYGTVEEKIYKLEKELKKLKEQILFSAQNSKLKRMQLDSQQKKQKIEQKQEVEDINKNCEILVREVMNNTGIIQFKLKTQEILERIQQKSIISAEQTEKRFQKIQDYVKLLQKDLKANKIIIAQEWIDPQCYAYKNNLVQMFNNKIIAKQLAILLSQIKLTQNNKFFIKIINIEDFIGIGIVDSNYKKLNNFSDLKNKFSYRSNADFLKNSVISPKNGQGFKQGQIIETNINLRAGKISWRVNNRVIFQFQDQLIRERINWVPYIVLSKQNEEIEIMNHHDSDYHR